MTAAILAALANGALAGALLTLAVWAGLLLAPRRVLNASARHVIWWTVLLAVVLLPLVYLPARQSMPGTGRATLPAIEKSALPLAPRSSPLPAARPASAPRSLRFPLVFTAGPWARRILFAWASISGVLLLALLVSCRLLARRKRTAVPAPDAIARPIAEAFGSRRASVLCTAGLGTPVLAGLHRPAILIPERLLAELTEQELIQVGLHEAAHLARRDDYTLLLQRMIEALLPFHPVIRWIVRQIDLEREIACDDLVVDRTGVSRGYAACLLRVVELAATAPESWAAAGVVGHRSQLARRIDQLLTRQPGVHARAGRMRLFSAIAIVLLLAGLAVRSPRAIALAAPRPPVPAPAPQPVPQSPQPPAATTPKVVDTQIVPVSVTDPSGRAVTGLTPQDFRIWEDGVEQKITGFSTASPPLSVELVIDSSGSMGGREPLVDAAVSRLVEAANPASEFLLLPFNDEVSMEGPFPADSDLILDQLHQVRARGGTGLRDAIDQALDWKKARYPDRIIVVISDGDDNASSVPGSQLRDAVLAANIPIYTILLESADNHRPRQPWLRDFAATVPYAVYRPADGREAGDLSFVQQTLYLLEYRSSNPPLAGKRTLKVDAVGRPPGTLRVSARNYVYSTGQ